MAISKKEKKEKLEHYIKSLIQYDSDIKAYQESRTEFKKSIKEEGTLSEDELKAADKVFSMIRAKNPLDLEDIQEMWPEVDKIVNSFTPKGE